MFGIEGIFILKSSLYYNLQYDVIGSEEAAWVDTLHVASGRNRIEHYGRALRRTRTAGSGRKWEWYTALQ